MSLWRASEVADATGGKASGEAEILGVEIDSRRVQPGDLFIALKGPNHDAHDYVAQAFANGAAAALVHETIDAPQEAVVIEVEDTFKALQALGHAARARTQATIIGITGSVGKTSTRAMLTAAFGAYGTVHATAGNYNNHFGVPITLARMPREVDYAVIEMGMNHAGEIRELTQMAKPHVAIITAVAAVHLEFFDSVFGIADAKAEIMEGLVAGGKAVLNVDNDYFAQLSGRANELGVGVVRFGHDEAEVQMLSSQIQGWGMDISANLAGQMLHYRIPTPGQHVAQNSLSVLGAMHALGLNPEPGAKALKHAEVVEGRGRPVTLSMDGKGCMMIDDSYNASPVSTAAAIQLLAQVVPDGARKLVVLGDMLELGESAPELHRELSEELINAGVDQLFTCGSLMKYAFNAVPQTMQGGAFDTVEALQSALPGQIQDGDWLLVKSSHGSGMWRLAQHLQDHYAVDTAETHEVRHAL